VVVVRVSSFVKQVCGSVVVDSSCGSVVLWLWSHCLVVFSRFGK
jgi:hypothetical protein